jgi:pantoate--beta-alanine ligase
MLCVRTIAELRSLLRAWKNSAHTIGLVPTMGALHDGHLSLVERSSALADRTIVTIFVNPMQFGENEDYGKYPRQEQDDLSLLEERGGCDAVFIPSVTELFPDGRFTLADFVTKVSVDRLSDRLCGLHRPGHFTAVATQVMKLLMISLPDIAVFGEKDYQQLQVIRRMVHDLNVPVAIDSAPTVREPDGLAMSSRNAYLTPDHRAIAPLLYQTLCAAANELQQGGLVDDVLQRAVTTLTTGGFRSVDYVSLVDAENLDALQRLDRPARIAAAVRLGPARLIDNIAVEPGAIMLHVVRATAK